MPDKEGTTPAKGVQEPVYNVELDGQIVNLIEGLSPEDLEEIRRNIATDENVEEGGENAVTEVEEAEKPKEEPISEVKREEPAAEEKPAETPKAEEALKFKIKRHGQEIDLDLTADQERLKTLVQLGYDYTQKTQELSREKTYIEAHKQILESQEFKNFLAQEQAEGRFVPEPAPAVDKTALTEYALRKLDPDFDLVRERMAALAITLGDDVAQVVNSDYAAFNRMYDRVASDVRKTKSQPATPQETPKEPAKLDAKVTERILKSKEVLKDKAMVEKPGVGTEMGSELEKWKKQDARLARRYKDSGRMEDAIALAAHRQYMPT